MPRKKEDLKLAWLQKSEEEKTLIRKKDAERKRLARAKNGIKKRSEMTPQELDVARTKDRRLKREKRKEMSEEEKKVVQAKDRLRKSEKTQVKLTNVTKSRQETQKIDLKLDLKEKKKLLQMSNNCKIQTKIRANRTEQEAEEVNVDLVIRNRRMRSSMSRVAKILAALKAKEGMREYRKFGYLREYKQRKRRDLYDPNSGKYIYSPISEYWKKKKEKETKEERKHRLKVMNKLRVERHREKVKKKLLEPLIMENNEILDISGMCAVFK